MEDWENATTVTEIVLTGLSTQPHVRAALFVLFFFVIYAVTVAANGLIVVLIVVDSHLHTPMYFFLSNLSFIDICYGTNAVPQTLAHCFTDRPTIPLGRCFAQMLIALFLGVADCLVLAVMAYDHFVAICSPLHYSLIMNRKVCIILAVSLWLSSFLFTIVPFFIMSVRLCDRNVLNHFACEAQAMLKLACSDIRATGLNMLILSVFTLLLPFVFILVTYRRIGLTILRIRSAQGRGKALSTCGSHLAVVGLYYGALLSMYLKPQTQNFTDREKVTAIVYGVVTPMLNPLIYSLRNRNVKGALRRLMGRKVEE